MDGKLKKEGDNPNRPSVLELEDVSILSESTTHKFSRIAQLKKRINQVSDTRHKVMVALLLVLIIVGIILIYHFATKKHYEVEVGKNIRFQQDTRKILISNTEKQVVLVGQLGLTVPYMLPYSCAGSKEDDTNICYGWKGFAEINISYIQRDTSNCYNIAWRTDNPTLMHKDCYSLSGAKWYGGGLFHTQDWPLNKAQIPVTPLITGSIHDKQSFGSVVERYWLSSNGVAIYGDWDVPLHVSINADADNQFCLYAKYEGSPYPNPKNIPPMLKYSVCTDKSIINLQKTALGEISKPPDTLPDRPLFEKPVWSTWAKYKRNVSSEVVENLVKMAKKDYDISMVVIGDGWEEDYGSLKFSKAKFPKNLVNIVQNIELQGVAISVWVHPFKNINTENFRVGVSKDFFVHDAGGEVPGLTEWFHGPRSPEWSNKIGAATDFTKPEALNWFRAQLSELTAFNINSFQFSLGESVQLPYMGHMASSPENPAQYTRAYTNLSASMVQGPSKAIITSAAGAQNIPLFVMLADKNSTFDSNNGLQTLIPSVLTLGLCGYHFVMPPPIGGTVYDGKVPSKELYVRWAGVSAFLQAMHFSIPPTDFDSETQTIIKNMINIHKNVVTPLVLAAAEEVKSVSAPIIRPVWWIASKDTTALAINDEFLIGNKTLVAPIVNSATKRDIYLPNISGQWYDNLNSKVIPAGWLKDYEVALHQVPYFSVQDVS